MAWKTGRIVRNVVLLIVRFAVVIGANELAATTNVPPRIKMLENRDIVEETIKRFEGIGSRWKAGDTNLPLIAIKWFNPYAVMESSVSREGVIFNGSFNEMGGKSWGYGGRENLSGTNLDNFKVLIDRLPPSYAGTNPVPRQILVSGMRSNSWFAFIYDRADIPTELERICDRINARIDWVVPSTSSSIAGTNGGGGEVRQLSSARTPVAVTSFHVGGADIWDLQKWQATRISPVQGYWTLVLRGADGNLKTNGFMTISDETTVSPDGKILVSATWNSIFALDLPVKTPLTPRWFRRKPGEYGQQVWCRQLAALDQGKSLAVALEHGVERWSLRSGEFQSLLTTSTLSNENFRPNSMKSSRDGKVLALETGDGDIEVLRSPWDKAPQHVTELPHGSLMEISPNGRFLAVRGMGKWEVRLFIYDLETGSRQDMPFRGCFNREAWWAAWSPDGKYLAVTSCGAWPCVYDTVTWKPILLWRVPGDGQYWSGGPCGRLAFTEDGMLLASYGDGVLRGLKLPVPPDALDWTFTGGR